MILVRGGYIFGSNTTKELYLQGGREMKTRNLFSAVIRAVPFVVVYCSAAVADDMDYQWQMQPLFSPTQQQMQLEDQGNVIIYRGVKSIDIALAMDRYFDRIDNMMFVNTVQTDDDGEPVVDTTTGEPVVDDDGC
jgi:hypothetical protein